jgi:hypothetical protein
MNSNPDAELEIVEDPGNLVSSNKLRLADTFLQISQYFVEIWIFGP